MGSFWKALADDNRRQIMLLLKKKNMVPTELATHFNFTLSAVSTHLRILKEADLIKESKEGKNRFYSLNRRSPLELIEFLEETYDFSMNSLKQYVDKNKGKSRKKVGSQ